MSLGSVGSVTGAGAEPATLVSRLAQQCFQPEAATTPFSVGCTTIRGVRFNGGLCFRFCRPSEQTEPTVTYYIGCDRGTFSSSAAQRHGVARELATRRDPEAPGHPPICILWVLEGPIGLPGA